MKNHSVFIKSFACILSTAAMVGTYAYSLEPQEKREIDYSAFKNAAKNIKHLTNTTSNVTGEKASDEAYSDVNNQIVAVIEKELQDAVKKSRIRPRVQKPQLVAKKAAPAPVLTTIYPTSFEINNSQLVYLWGFEFDQLSYESFQNTEIAQISVEEKIADKVVDEVKVTQASPEETVIDNGDDLVVFDYGTSETESGPASEEVPVIAESSGPIEPVSVAAEERDYRISNVVKNAISRELNKNKAVVSIHGQEKKVAPKNTNTVSTEEIEALIASEDAIVYDYSNVKQSTLKKKETDEASFASAFTGSVAQVTHNLKAFEVKFGTEEKVESLSNFEFVPDYDRGERVHDAGSGEITFVSTLSDEVSTQTGVLQAQGLIPTRVDMNLLEESANIPMLNEVSIHEYLQKEEVNLDGNFILIEKSAVIKDVEIDVNHAYKVLLGRDFKMVDTQDEAAYVLFMGTPSGNVLVRYMLSNNETASKISYVGDGEVYFEAPKFEESTREMFTLNTRSLLGTKIRELNIQAQDVKLFGVNTQAKKTTINSYEFKLPKMIAGERKYLEFKHLGHNLIVGTKNQKELEIPGDDFIRKVMDVNGVNALTERCMVQINFTQDLRDIKVSGKNKAGEMFVETTFLDKDGNFSVDSSELSEKAFIIGDQEGIFNARIEYSDGSQQYLKTFCSEGSYIVEQL